MVRATSRSAGAVRNVTVAWYACEPGGLAVRAVGLSVTDAGPVAILAAAPAAPPAVRRPIPARNLRRSMSQVSAILQAVSKLVTIGAANKANKL